MAEGLITVQSAYPAAATIDRLADAVSKAGMQVFARVDHAAGAEQVGLPLRPTQLLIFGQARGGTPLMQETRRPASTCRSRRWPGPTRPGRPGSATTTRSGSRSGTAWPSRAPRRCRRCAARWPNWLVPPPEPPR